ncbi:MAG: prefoldin subunit alpha [Candidatus Aenigmatarchaeota archaeon]
MDQKEMQEKALMYQLLQRQLEEFNEKGMLLERKAGELGHTKNAMEELSKIKKGNKVMIPLGGESYTYGTVEDPENIMVEIGSNLVMKKTIKEAQDVVNDKRADIETLTKQIQEDITKMIAKMNEIAQEVQAAQQQPQVTVDDEPEKSKK